MVTRRRQQQWAAAGGAVLLAWACAMLCLSSMVQLVVAQAGDIPEGTLELTPAQSVFREIIVDNQYQDNQADLTQALITTRSDYVSPGIDHDTYAFAIPPVDEKGRADYKISVIIDPCRDMAVTCCDGVYGASEFRKDPTDLDEPPRSEDNKERSPLTSRLADPTFEWDTSCFTDANDQNVARRPVVDYQPDTTPGGVAIITDVDPPLLPEERGSVCVAHNGARVPFPQYPNCWDFNTTVDATKNCTGVGGTAVNCMMVGYSQTAFVAECGKRFRLNGHCGTFLEIHVKDDPTVLSSVQVAGGIHTGFRLAAMPLNWKGNPYRLLCKGSYEIWWVQKTRWNYQIEYKKTFTIVEPACTFDLLNSKFQIYRETKVASELFDQNPDFYGERAVIGF